MEALKSTTFAHVCPQTKNLPTFLVKKLEEAIVHTAIKNQKDSKKALEEKLLKAQRNREEKRSMRVIKVMVHNDKINHAGIQKITERINVNQIQQEILDTKLQIADLKAKEHIQKQLLKAQKMGTTRVNQARQQREELKAKENSKVYKEDNGSNLKQSLNKSISDKNKERNYNILKNAIKQRFQSVVKRQKGLVNFEEKQANAQARRDLIIKKKVEKARELGGLVENVEVVKTVKLFNLASNISKADPCEDFSEREIAILKQAKKQQEEKMVKATKARESILEGKINKAKDLQTMYGPTEEQKRVIKEQKQKKKAYKLNFDKSQKRSVCFSITAEKGKITDGSDNESDRSVFVQTDIEALKRKPHMKNVKQTKRGAIAFEITRTETRSQTTRNSKIENFKSWRKSSDEDHWEIV